MNLAEKVRRIAEAKTAAQIYRYDNNYLNTFQKHEVEIWYQFPWTIRHLVFCICLICFVYFKWSLFVVFGITIFSDIVSGLINWNTNLVMFRLRFYEIFTKLILWIITLLTMAVLIFKGHYFLSALALFSISGFSTLVSPFMWIYANFSKKYEMNPKYVYFKLFYNKTFPFENIEAKIEEED